MSSAEVETLNRCTGSIVAVRIHDFPEQNASERGERKGNKDHEQYEGEFNRPFAQIEKLGRRV